MNLIERRDVTQQTRDMYHGEAFSWDSSDDAPCVHLAHHHLAAAGHNVPRIPSFDTPLGARRALEANGWDSVGDMLDEFLEPIAVAQMKMGDLAIIPGDDGFDAIFLCLGPLKMFGWADETGLCEVAHILDLGKLTGAWSL